MSEIYSGTRTIFLFAFVDLLFNAASEFSKHTKHQLEMKCCEQHIKDEHRNSSRLNMNCGPFFRLERTGTALRTQKFSEI